MKSRRHLVPKESTRAKPKKIFGDEVKERHTSHWDWDYLSEEQVGFAYEDGRAREREQSPMEEQPDLN